MRNKKIEIICKGIADKVNGVALDANGIPYLYNIADESFSITYLSECHGEILKLKLTIEIL
jgi:hypothetical protein